MGIECPFNRASLHIDMILERANPEQLAKLGKAYKCGEVGRPVQSKGVIELRKVSGPIKLTKSIILEAGETVKVNGLSQVKGNVKRLHIVAKPIRHEVVGSEVPQVITVLTYSCVYAGFTKSYGDVEKCHK